MSIKMAEQYTPSYAIPVAGFESKKAAQLCAFFALRSPSATIEKLKLIKLIYLTERNFVAEHHVPMLYDELYSLPHGPICSGTLNGIDGIIQADLWTSYLSKNGNEVFPVRNFSRDELDELSDAEIDVAEAVWTQFGGMTASRIRNWSHDHCSEYTETEKSRIPIRYGDILEALGDAEAAADLDREVRDIRRADGLLAA